MAGSKEDFDVWEGWVHSRMRLLVKSAGMMVDVRPWPKAFKPPQPAGAAAAGGSGGGGGGGGGGGANGANGGVADGGATPFRSFYFMGLSKKKVL